MPFHTYLDGMHEERRKMFDWLQPILEGAGEAILNLLSEGIAALIRLACEALAAIGSS